MARADMIILPIRWVRKRIVIVLLFLVKVYQMGISPYLPRACRFVPTCSEYCKEALVKYGPVKGSWLTLKRLLRCHPFSKGGYDPLPPE